MIVGTVDVAKIRLGGELAVGKTSSKLHWDTELRTRQKSPSMNNFHKNHSQIRQRSGQKRKRCEKKLGEEVRLDDETQSHVVTARTTFGKKQSSEELALLVKMKALQNFVSAVDSA